MALTYVAIFVDEQSLQSECQNKERNPSLQVVISDHLLCVTQRVCIFLLTRTLKELYVCYVDECYLTSFKF